MAEEEREDVADLRLHADLQLRYDIAVAFAVFEARHAGGIRARDRDPQGYIENRTSAC